jgi:hypothetical protein
VFKFSDAYMRCVKCGGIKCVGEEYYSLGKYWVDVTCIKCGHSADIQVDKLNKILEKIRDDNK